MNLFSTSIERYNFEIRFDGLTWNPVNSGLELSWVEKKQGKEKLSGLIQRDSAKTLSSNSLTFIFLLK